VKAIATVPTFRYDLKMLKEGKCSSDSHLLPRGPNNPSGVIGIAFDKNGLAFMALTTPTWTHGKPRLHPPRKLGRDKTGCNGQAWGFGCGRVDHLAEFTDEPVCREFAVSHICQGLVSHNSPQKMIWSVVRA
jgi:hypothetical protein